MRWLPALVGLVGGCDSVFGVEHGGGATTTCISPGVSIDFETPPEGGACRPFGFGNGGDATMRVVDGQLVIEPEPRRAEANGCTAGAPVQFEHGIFTEVTSIFAHFNAFVTFNYHGQIPEDAVRASLSASAGYVRLLDASGESVAEVPYEPGSQWWKLRPSDDGAGVVAEVSADGLAWTRLGIVGGRPPDQVIVQFSAGVGDDEASAPGEAAFEQVNVCP